MTASLITNARSLLELRRYAQAEKAIRTHLAAEPQDAEALRLLAVTLHQQDRDKEALEASVAAINVEPDHVRGLLVLATIQRKLGQQELALDSATRALRAAPHDWTTFYTRAHVQLAQPQPQPAAALSDSLKAVELAPDEPQAHNMLGMTYAALHQPDRARQAYEDSLALDPTNVWAMNNLAALRMNRGRLSVASGQLRSGLSLDPQQGLLHRNYDVLLVRLLNRLWWLSACLGVVQMILLGRHASVGLRAAIGLLGILAISGITYRSKRHLPEGRLGILRGLWSRMAGPAQTLMALWGLTGICTLLTCFAPGDVAQPAGRVLIAVTIGLGLSGVIRQIRRAGSGQR